MNEIEISMKEIGQKVRQARNKKGYKQAELAEILNISNQYISKIEKGKANIALELLLKLAYALEENLFYFLSIDSLSKYSGNSDDFNQKYYQLSQSNKALTNTIIDSIYENQENELKNEDK